MPHDGRLHVARGDEFLKPERIEVERKISEEITLKRIVAVAENGLAAQLRLVVLQLVFDVAKLGVKLILLGLLGVSERSVSRSRRASGFWLRWDGGMSF